MPSGESDATAARTRARKLRLSASRSDGATRTRSGAACAPAATLRSTGAHAPRTTVEREYPAGRRSSNGELGRGASTCAGSYRRPQQALRDAFVLQLSAAAADSKLAAHHGDR